MERVYIDLLEKIETFLGFDFNNKSLLLQAFTHRSYLNEHKTHQVGQNERLEFYGDAVLEFIVTDFLYRRFPDDNEGSLTDKRAALVSAYTLAPLIEEMGIADLILLSKGERRSFVPGDKARHYICANLFEAILGALYLDKGIGECRLFVDHFLLKKSESIISQSRDYKGLLQNDAQARFSITPAYRVLSSDGPDHAARFVMGCYLDTVLVAQAEGASKKEAEKAAAKLAYETSQQWEGRIAKLGQTGCAIRRSNNGGQ